jgi:cell filamentation protein
VKLLLDTCVWGGIRAGLISAGHDVVWAGEWKEDPGDDEFWHALIVMAAYSSRWTRISANSQLCTASLTAVEHLAQSLATVHVEFVLIHPFREGNGRVGRLLAVLMGLQAGLPPLYFDKLFWSET